jgi:Xaa-Pro aminopeptidase
MSIYEERLQKIRQEMEAQGVELLFLPPSPPLFYATGMRHAHFAVMRVPGDWLTGAFIGLDQGPIFVAQWMLARHAGTSEVMTGQRVLEEGEDPFELLRSVLAEFQLPARRVAVAGVTNAKFTTALRAAMPDVKMSLASDFMEPLLAVKDEHAIQALRRIGAITDAAYQEVLKWLDLGVSEQDVAVEVDYQLRRLGCEDNSFQTGVRFARPGDDPPTPDKRLQPCDSVTFDFGGVYDGYSSDFGRSVYAGDPPAEYLKVHDTVLQAQAEAMSAMKAGQITCEQADAIARQVIIDAGYGPNFTHRLGHGIGITVHERPFLNVGETTVLEAGMTFTVEPSIRVPGRFSNRVEDVVLVTEEGGVYLTTYPRVLHVLA